MLASKKWLAVLGFRLTCLLAGSRTAASLEGCIVQHSFAISALILNLRKQPHISEEKSIMLAFLYCGNELASPRFRWLGGW